MSAVSVVVPMHATRHSLDELVARVAAVVPDGELVLVDDECPEGSGRAVLDLGVLPGGLRGVLVQVRPRVGQLSAVLIGLRSASAPVTVVMDADLQDPPEAIPTLLDALASGGSHAVASARRGAYESRTRMATARCYRRVLHLASGGRVPPEAGLFLAMDRHARDAVLALGDPRAPLVPALARAGVRISTVPVVRHRRRHGGSASGGRVRVGTAVRGLLTVLPVHPVALRLRLLRWHEPSITITHLEGPT